MSVYEPISAAGSPLNSQIVWKAAIRAGSGSSHDERSRRHYELEERPGKVLRADTQCILCSSGAKLIKTAALMLLGSPETSRNLDVRSMMVLICNRVRARRSGVPGSDFDRGHLRTGGGPDQPLYAITECHPSNQTRSATTSFLQPHIETQDNYFANLFTFHSSALSVHLCQEPGRDLLVTHRSCKQAWRGRPP